MKLMDTIFLLEKIAIPIVSIILLILLIIIAYRKGAFSKSPIFEPNKLDPDIKSKVIESLNDKNREVRLEALKVLTRNGAYRKDDIDEEPIDDNLYNVTFDIDRFNEYHSQSLSQSKISFWFSLIFASIGFFIITTSIFTYNKEQGFSNYIGIVAGTIIDAVSALFFYQSNKARQLMSEFFDRLRMDRKMMESLRLCNSIDDDPMRNSLKITFSLYFSGLQKSEQLAKDIINATILSKTNKDLVDENDQVNATQPNAPADLQGSAALHPANR